MTKANAVLTKRGLILRLRRLGLMDISERRVTDWIAKGLLPRFDRQGRGLGKGRGRSDAEWNEPRKIVERSVRVERLLRVLPSSEACRFALWLEGEGAAAKEVKGFLLEPLHELRRRIDHEAFDLGEKVLDPKSSSFQFRRGGLIEDLLFEVIYDCRSGLGFDLPPEVSEVLMNLFANPYFFSGNPTESLDRVVSARHRFTEWDREIDSKIETAAAPVLPTRSVPDAGTDGPSNGFQLILKNPEFFRNIFSLDSLIETLEEASDADLRKVEKDLATLRNLMSELWSYLGPIIESSRLWQDAGGLTDGVILIGFRLARIAVLADLALRHRGYESQVETAVAALAEGLSAELARHSPMDFHDSLRKIEEALPPVFTLLEQVFTKRPDQASLTVVDGADDLE